MLIPEKHKNEIERLKLLESYSILDTLPEEDFDNLTAIASIICNTPISLITLLDNDRQWFKSNHGLPIKETPRDYAFCAHAINDISGNVLIVEDARIDIRFHDNPLVIGEPNIVFYAGVPLTNSNGLPLGTLCVIDHKPHLLNEIQLNALKALAGQLMNLLELRRNKILLEKAILELDERNQELDKFAFIAAHDLKSPLNNIASLTELFQEEYNSIIDEKGQNIIELVRNSSEHLRGLIDGLLEYSKSTKIIHGNKENIELEKLREELIVLFSFENKCNVNIISDLKHIYVNKTAIEQILIHLITNAIKFNNKPNSEIEITITKSEKKYKFIVKDNGPGISKEHHQKIFQLYENLNKKDQFGHQGKGIGLATVKKLVENLGGTISVESEMRKGASFIFTLDT